LGDGPHGLGSGIHVITFTPLDGAFGATSTAAELRNPSYFIRHHDTDRLFSVEEPGGDLQAPSRYRPTVARAPVGSPTCVRFL